jgi:hypothetical protein
LPARHTPLLKSEPQPILGSCAVAGRRKFDATMPTAALLE